MMTGTGRGFSIGEAVDLGCIVGTNVVSEVGSFSSATADSSAAVPSRAQFSSSCCSSLVVGRESILRAGWSTPIMRVFRLTLA